MQKQTIKRIGNLVFAGAVMTGAVWPLSTDAYALELPPLSSQSALSVLQYTNTSEAGDDKSKIVLLAAGDSHADLPTLEDYLGKLVCSGCGKRCPLTNLRCNRGQRSVESATAEYDSMVAAASVTVDLEPAASEEAAPADQTELADSTSPDTEQANADTPSEAAPVLAENPQAKPTVSAAETAVEATDSTAADMVDRVAGYLPLAGIACGGIYLAADGIKKRKHR